MAERLAAEGGCVVVADLDAAKAGEVAASIGSADVAVGVAADVSTNVRSGAGWRPRCSRTAGWTWRSTTPA